MITILVITLLIGQLLAQHPWEPQYRNEDYFKNWHEQLMNQTKMHGKEAQIVFLGDSITQGWRYSGAPIWDKFYAPRHAFNYGVGGDRTENILWRLANKEFDGVNPKVVVLMIGISIKYLK